MSIKRILKSRHNHKPCNGIFFESFKYLELTKIENYNPDQSSTSDKDYVPSDYKTASPIKKRKCKKSTKKLEECSLKQIGSNHKLC